MHSYKSIVIHTNHVVSIVSPRHQITPSIATLVAISRYGSFFLFLFKIHHPRYYARMGLKRVLKGALITHVRDRRWSEGLVKTGFGVLKHGKYQWGYMSRDQPQLLCRLTYSSLLSSTYSIRYTLSIGMWGTWGTWGYAF